MTLIDIGLGFVGHEIGIPASTSRIAHSLISTVPMVDVSVKKVSMKAKDVGSRPSER
jgi:hypothetical protein